MAISTTERSKIVQLAVGMFNAAPGGYLTELVDMYTAAGKSMTALANQLASIDAYKANFPSYLSKEEIAAQVAAQYGLNKADNGIGTEAYNYVLAELTAGKSVGEIYVAANDFMYNTTLTNWAAPHNLFVNQVKIADYYTVTKQGTEKDLNILKAALSEVTASTDFTTTAKMDAFLASISTGMTQNMLTTGQDILTTGSANDTFNAFLVDNANTFQSGDILNGGAGTDTLKVELGNSHKFAIAGKTQSVEKVMIQKQTYTDEEDSDNGTDSSNGYGTNDYGFSDIDAQDMATVREWWSVDSRGDVQVEDVRSASYKTTIGLRNTDMGDVDYEVYFDHAEAPQATNGSSLYLRILDLQSMEKNGTPLSTNPYNGVTFTDAGNTITAKADAAFTGTFQDMVNELNASLASQGYANLVVSLGSTYTVVKADTGVSYTGTEIVITDTAGGILGTGTWTTPTGSLPADQNTYTKQSTLVSTTTYLTQTDIVLDNAGRGSQTGDLIVGLITDDNTDGGAQKAGEGIQQFNVKVDRNSWISTLSSTENVLEVVNVVNIAENNAAANGNVRIDDLTDVRVFDASAMAGQVNLTATLSDAVVGKYLNLKDFASNHNSDNVSFNYSTGTANDTINMTMDSANLLYAGTASYDDFNLNIVTGAGNDSITTKIEDGSGVDTTPWYINHVQNANLAINAGDGDDTIATVGAGNFTINAGSGNDTVYTDNSGDKAKWVVNSTAASTIADPGLVSIAPKAQFLFGAELTVSFSAAAASLTAADAAFTAAHESGAVATDNNMYDYTNGFEVTKKLNLANKYTGSQADVNQAIKDLINNDVVLNKFLVAKDGPGFTLVIESLVDGLYTDADLLIDLTAADFEGLGSDQAAAITAYKTFMQDSTATLDQAVLDAQVVALETTYSGGAATTILADVKSAGTESAVATDNVVTLGAGDDVIALSTSDLSNDTLVYAASEQFGKDTILNFEAGAVAGADVFNFTAWMNDIISASGSTESQARNATTLLDTNAAAANTVDSNMVVLLQFNEDLATGETFEALTADKLKAAVNFSNTGTANYGNIGEDSLEGINTYVTTGAGKLVGGVGHAIIMVENNYVDANLADTFSSNANKGEYKVFEVSWDATATNVNGDFSSVTLIGTIDVGHTMNAVAVVGNFA